MAEWQVGDLALCVTDGRASNARRGAIYKVTRVWPSVPFSSGWREGLTLDGIAHPAATAKGYQDAVASRWFRKVTPPEADEFDRETIALLTGAGQEVGA